jgi:short-subunit dehydrogenase
VALISPPVARNRRVKAGFSHDRSQRISAMAAPRLKPLHQQAIVLTGATSGIGLATARLAARRGARLLLVARNEDALKTLCADIRSKGGTAEYVVADVAERSELDAVARRAAAVFGGFDSWINDAGAFIYGPLDAVALDDQRRLFDVVYWGVVHGTLAAAAQLRHRGGAIVNVGSVLGEFAIPFQGPYCAAKFAVKGFTEAFRRELRAEGLPISLTLVKPAAIDTPFMEHARNAMGSAGTRNPPPAYHPHLVARAIVHGCEHPVRDIVVGGMGGLSLVVANRLVPRLMDRLLAAAGRPLQTSDDPGRADRRDNLHAPREDLAERSTLRPFTRKTSLALEAQLHPLATAAIATLGLLTVGALSRRD